MRIVTGYTGTEHITSNDDQGLNQGIFGSGSCVLHVGNQLAATLADANTVNIADGEGMLQGVHFRVDPGTVDAVTIASGTVGYNRIDLICARYTKNAITGVEAVNWHVIQGELSDSTPTEPTCTEGDVLNGDTVADFPIWKVTLTGLTPVVSSAISRPLTISGLLDYVYPVGSIYMSVNSTSPANIMGGTWAQLKDRFLLGAGNTYSNGATGGEATHTLTTNEIPSHTHKYYNFDTYKATTPTSTGNEYGVPKTSSETQSDTTATGGGAAHNNMPPYLVVYMWKRTA